MAENIRGINVQIGSDTTGLSKALSDVNKRSRDIQSELRQVEKLLKFDPGNTELLAQKQKLLSDAVENTSQKLNRLRTVQEQVNKQFASGEISEGQYRAFNREIAKAEQELSGFETKLESVNPKFKKLGDSAESAASRIKSAGESMKSAGEKMSVGITAPLVGIAALATEGTEEMRKSFARLEVNAQAAGTSLEDVQDEMRDLNAVTGETDSNVEGLSNLLASGFQGDTLRQAMEELSGAAIKFSDTLKFEGIADGLQETLATGEAIGPFAELLERSSVNLDDFNAGLQDAIKNGTEQQYVLDQLANLGLAEVNEQYRQNNQAMIDNANAQYDLQQALAQLGDLLLPIMTAITDGLANLLTWFNSLGPGTQNFILAIAGIAAGLGPLLVIVGQVVSSLSALAPIFGAIASPVGLVVAAVAGLAAGLVYLYNNNETVRAGLQAAWEAIKSTAEKVFGAIKSFWDKWGTDIIAAFKKTFDVIKTTFKTVFDAISTVVKTIFNALKDFWSKWGETIKGTFQNAFEALKIIFGAIFQAISDVVINIFNGLQAFWSTWGKTIQGVFTTALNVVKTIFSGAWTAIKTTIETSISVISGIVKAFLAVLQGDWKGAWDAIKGVAESVWNGIKSTFSNVGETMRSIGKDIMNGLINGITDMADAVWESAKDVAGKIKNGFKDFFGIKSPSRLMMGYGQYISEGLAIGIANAGGMAVKSAKNLSGAVSKAMSINPTNLSIAADAAVQGVRPAGGQSSGQTSYTQHITINSPQPLSPSDIARKSKQASRQLALEWGM